MLVRHDLLIPFLFIYISSLYPLSTYAEVYMYTFLLSMLKSIYLLTLLFRCIFLY
jgi:hypothetical protein